MNDEFDTDEFYKPEPWEEDEQQRRDEKNGLYPDLDDIAN